MRELDLLWHTAVGAGLISIAGNRASVCPGGLRGHDADGLLAAWRGALDAVLGCGPTDVSEELEGLATLLYAAGAPVRMDALADAFAAATAATRAAEGPGGAAARPIRGRGCRRHSKRSPILASRNLVSTMQDDQLTVALTALGAAGMRGPADRRGFLRAGPRLRRVLGRGGPADGPRGL